MWRLIATSTGIFGFLGIVANASQGQNAFHVDGSKMKQALTPSVSRFVEKLMQSMRAPGVSVGVVHLHNGTVRTEFGAWGNKSEDGDPVVPETLFNIGSCSKAFTSTALAILMDDFANHRNVTPLPPNIIEFEWHTKVKDLLPSEWGLVDEWAFKKANLRDILSHVSGLPRHEFSYGKSDTPADVTRKMKHLNPTHELREEWSYNNQMYMLASYIISRYSGKSFIDFVKERIFEPLGMTSTTYIGNEVETTGQLSQAFTLHNGTVVRRIPILAKGDFVGILAGPGGILSSTVDMHKWLAMMLNHGIDPYTNRTIIPLRAYSEITYAHYIAFGAGFPGSSIQGYGLGWARVSYQGHESSGGVPGFTTQTIIMPFDGLAVIALVNQEALLPVLAAARIVEDYLKLARSVPADDASLQPDISFPTQLTTAFNTMDIPGHFLRQTFFKPPLPLFEKNAKPLWGKRPLGLPLEKYAGTYFNPGYDSFTLCVPQTPHNQYFTTDTYCSSVLSDFAKVHPTNPPSFTIGLYGSWARGWSSHIRLTHQDREAFSLSVLTLFPDGFGKDKSPFSTSLLGASEIHAEFVLSEDGNTVDGLAVPEGFEYDVPLPSPGSARDLKKDAFVYFTKVN